MQRWQLNVGLVGLAALAALVVPQLAGRTGLHTPAQDPVGSPGAPLTPAAPTAPAGVLALEAGLDHPVVSAGRVEERLLVMTVTAPEDPDAPSRPINVSVVMDRSGSMAGKNKMTWAREAAAALLAELDADDRFSFVTFSDRAELVVPSSLVLDRERLTRVVQSVREGGGTNLYEGLTLGMDQVKEQAGDDKVNRVIVLSDGIANLGVTDSDALAATAARYAGEGIAVSTMGLGLDFNEDLLSNMADRSGGTYRFVNDPSTLTAQFEEELKQLSSVAANGVSVDVDLNGAQLVEVFGYQAEPTTGGFRVWLGDVYAGQTRKVVVRVRVPAGESGEQIAVATAKLSELGQERHYEPVAVQATASSDLVAVERTVNKPLAVAARAAESGALADKAARAYAAGDKDESLRLAAAANLVAGEAASRYAAPALQAQAEDLAEQQRRYEALDNATEEGRLEVKKNKEVSREWYH